MGKYDLAIKFGKSLLSDTANYVKACGKRSILETKPPIFHGINPTLTYAPSGKSFALPRFCTEEMKQARQMNKIAIRQAKAGEVVRTYPKATPQDLKRLTSETIEDSYSRVEWTNPKDGKVYNLLKQGETEDGQVIVRILDKEGAFIKEAEIVPKKICIVDTFDSTSNGKIPHGILINIYAKRNNPFAIIDIKNIGAVCNDGSAAKDFLDVLKTVDNCDYLSLSIGSKYRAPKTDFNTLFAEMAKFKKSPAGNDIQKWDDILGEIKGRGIRILQAANNDGRYSVNMTLGKNAEGVGSISANGRIALFSGSRNSGLTQHYELGTYYPQKIYINGKLSGYNITGLRGIDIPLQDIEKAIKLVKHETDRLSGELKTMLQREAQLKEELDSIEATMRKEIFDLPHEEFLTGCDKIRKKYEYLTKPLENEIRKIFFEKSRIETLIKKSENINTDSILTNNDLWGTSFSTPVRTAKLALNDMMEGIL